MRRLFGGSGSQDMNRTTTPLRPPASLGLLPSYVPLPLAPHAAAIADSSQSLHLAGSVRFVVLSAELLRQLWTSEYSVRVVVLVAGRFESLHLWGVTGDVPEVGFQGHFTLDF